MALAGIDAGAAAVRVGERGACRPPAGAPRGHPRVNRATATSSLVRDLASGSPAGRRSRAVERGKIPKSSKYCNFLRKRN